MTEMSAVEAAVVARFEAGEPAPESWDGGLRSAIARALHHDWHPDEEWDAIPDSVRGYYRRFADVTLALPEVAALRAKADAADRVRELAEDAAEMNDETARSLRRLTDIKARHEGLRDAYRDAANHLRRALDGADREDRGRC